MIYYLKKNLIDEQVKRLAQQEYNNMLEDLQEDDNVDDDGEILKMIYLYKLILLFSFLFIVIL